MTRGKPTVAQIIVGWLWSLAGILALILLIAAIWTAVD